MSSYRWRARAVFWGALAACASVACRTTDHKDERRAAASAALPRPSASTRGLGQTVPTLPREFAIEFRARPGKVPNTVELLVVVPSLPELTVGTVSVHERCGIVPARTLPMKPDGSWLLRNGVKWTCPQLEVPVWLEDDVLRVGERTYPISSSASISFPSQVVEAPPEDCGPNKAVPVEVRLERRATGDEPGAPWALGVRMGDAFFELGRLPRVSMQCWSRQTGAGMLHVNCEYGKEGMALEVVARSAGLAVDWFRNVNTFTGVQLERRFTLIPGCGVEPRIPLLAGFKLRDKDFKPYVPSCSERCVLEEPDCVRSCGLRNYPEDPETGPCPAECRTKRESCTRRCEAR